MLIASMNPCPCGYYNHPTKHCVCSPGSVAKYLNHISGPMLDRIDLQVEVTPVPFSDLTQTRPEESSSTIRERVIAARHIQQKRFAGTNIHTNSMMSSRQLREVSVGSRVCQTARNRHGTSESFGPGLRSNHQSGSNHCRFGGKSRHSLYPYRRSNPIPQP